MRWLALLLLLLNAALFGYFKLNEAHPVGVVSGHEAIAPEKITILTAEALAALPKKSAAPAVPAAPTPAPMLAPEPAVCYEWGSFPADSLARAKGVLTQFGVESSVRQTATQEARRYWIYIPPRKNAEEAQAKSDELKALGVQEIFVVQEPKWRYALSLGVFKDEALATRLLEDLRSKGIKSAVKATRNHETGQSSFLIRHASDQVVEAIGMLQPDFPGSELKKVACP